MKKTPKNAESHQCEMCSFTCSKLCDFNRHLTTLKHTNRLNRTKKAPKNAEPCFVCDCGKSYNARNSLWYHKKKCNTNPDASYHDEKDQLIEQLVNENREMKSMFTMMVEKYEAERIRNQTDRNELMNKMIDIIPKVGHTTNNINIEKQSLNFYLTNTCKNAESIHDFTDRYVKRCTNFFIENHRFIANNQMCLATNVYELFFKCLEENPQYMNFIQTTDVKNGILYVKEKKKDENRQLYGEAEFIKYVDGFEKAGASIGHAINKAFVPLQTEFTKKLEQEVGRAPNEDEYEDEEEYEDVLDKYKQRKQESGHYLLTHVYNAMSLFDSKTRKMEVLAKTKRIKSDDNLIA